MTHTHNYHLPLWELSDPFKMSDFNQMSEDVESALTAMREKLTEQAGRNYIVQTGAYAGTGRTANTLTFPHDPVFIMIQSPESSWAACIQGCPQCVGSSSPTSFTGISTPVSWDGHSVTLSGNTNNSMTSSFNNLNHQYFLLAILDANT